MGDVALLMCAVYEVGHGPHRPDAHIVTAVSLRVQGLARGLEVAETQVCLLMSPCIDQHPPHL